LTSAPPLEPPAWRTSLQAAAVAAAAASFKACSSRCCGLRATPHRTVCSNDHHHTHAHTHQHTHMSARSQRACTSVIRGACADVTDTESSGAPRAHDTPSQAGACCCCCCCCCCPIKPSSRAEQPRAKTAERPKLRTPASRSLPEQLLLMLPLAAAALPPSAQPLANPPPDPAPAHAAARPCCCHSSIPVKPVTS
jgi:hypothetical protein